MSQHLGDAALFERNPGRPGAPTAPAGGRRTYLTSPKTAERSRNRGAVTSGHRAPPQQAH